MTSEDTPDNSACRWTGSGKQQTPYACCGRFFFFFYKISFLEDDCWTTGTPCSVSRMSFRLHKFPARQCKDQLSIFFSHPLSVCVCVRLQALVYDILPSTTAVFGYTIGSRKLSAYKQFFVGAQIVVSLLQTTQIKQGMSLIATKKVNTSTNKTTIV